MKLDGENRKLNKDLHNINYMNVHGWNNSDVLAQIYWSRRKQTYDARQYPIPWMDDVLVYSSLTHLTLEHISQSMNIGWDTVKAMLEQAVNFTDLTLFDVKTCVSPYERITPLLGSLDVLVLNIEVHGIANIDRVLAMLSATVLELFIGELHFPPLLVAVAKAKFYHVQLLQPPFTVEAQFDTLAAGKILANLAPCSRSLPFLAIRDRVNQPSKNILIPSPDIE
ncbi:hypothetical protein C8R44DRAFT_737210 [Mycena epipterygia]|nr:hypothetical protein C8R44DRAFT_737210 [Mycena epipterygia]